MDVINVKNLKAFLQVCRFGNITTAANTLYITPQGLSKIIKNLECELGVNLFVRGPHGLTMTEYAEQLARRAPLVIQELESIASGNFIVPSAGLPKSVVLGITFGVLDILTLDFIKAFQEQHPEIRFQIDDGTDNEIEHNLWTEKADIIIVNGPIDSSRFWGTYLYSLRNCFVIHNSNPLSKAESLSYGDLGGEKIIFPSQEFKSYNIHMNRFMRAGVTPEVAYRSTELIYAHQLCNENHGIALSLEIFAKNHPYPNTTAVSISDADCQLDTYLAYKAGRPISEETQILIEYIVDWVHAHF